VPPGSGPSPVAGRAESAPAPIGAPRPHHPIPEAALQAFLANLDYEFGDPDLLGRALTHRSWCAEHAGFESNERLEFLGDAVLGLVVTDDIYLRIPDAAEGQLSRVRASVVCAPALAEMAQELGIGAVMLLGKGEAATGGRERQSILADAMEAVIGAVYLDGGLADAQALIDRLVAPRLDAAGTPDHKSRLHELVARDHRGRLSYEMSDHGPEHDKTFEAVVLLDGEPIGSGTGRSKKSAEQGAAQQALLRLGPRAGDIPRREEADG
jgi:ribonuclease-3